MADIDWYFDFISPFAYLQLLRLRDSPLAPRVRPVPVLFAGLLGHWQHKGPAEIPAKRRFTYRQVTWYARRHGIPFRMPAAHPFNPLPALRLAIAAGAGMQAVSAIFEHIWWQGRLPGEAPQWDALAARLGVADPAAACAEAAVKAQLRTSTEHACQLGVFGVPTAVVGGELFWGLDATDMLMDYLQDPARFADAEYTRVSDLPSAATRPGAT